LHSGQARRALRSAGCGSVAFPLSRHPWSFMNRIYRLVFNRTTGLMQVASELATSPLPPLLPPTTAAAAAVRR